MYEISGGKKSRLDNEGERFFTWDYFEIQFDANFIFGRRNKRKQLTLSHWNESLFTFVGFLNRLSIKQRASLNAVRLHRCVQK